VVNGRKVDFDLTVWRSYGGSRVNAVFRDISCMLGCSGPQIWVLVKNGQKVTFWVKWSKIDFWPHGFGGLVDGAVG